MQEIVKKQRPLFLSILCVLTLLGSSYQLTGSFGSYRAAEETEANPQEIIGALDELDELELPVELEHLPEAIGESALANNVASKIRNNAMGLMVSSIFTLVGMMGMWRMKRLGFLAYLVGIAIYIATPWMAFEGIMADIQGYLALAVGGFFTLLYSLNLKHLS